MGVRNIAGSCRCRRSIFWWPGRTILWFGEFMFVSRVCLAAIRAIPSLGSEQRRGSATVRDFDRRARSADPHRSYGRHYPLLTGSSGGADNTQGRGEAGIIPDRKNALPVTVGYLRFDALSDPGCVPLALLQEELRKCHSGNAWEARGQPSLRWLRLSYFERRSPYEMLPRRHSICFGIGHSVAARAIAVLGPLCGQPGQG